MTSLGTYQTQVVAAMKETGRADKNHGRQNVIGGSGSIVGYLIPVGTSFLDDAETIRCMTEWREATQFAFPSRFPVSRDRTATWLASQVVNRSDRLLFLVTEQSGTPVGHLGVQLNLADPSSVELDNVVRGNRSSPGLMGYALKALERWCADHLKAAEMILQVLESNHHARAFYDRYGYLELKRVPMEWDWDGNEGQLIPATGEPDDQMITMSLQLAGSP